MITVCRAESVDEANFVAVWLNAQGVTAFVKDQIVAGTFDIPIPCNPLGIEVYVPDAEQAARSCRQESIRLHARGVGRDVPHVPFRPRLDPLAPALSVPPLPTTLRQSFQNI